MAWRIKFKEKAEKQLAKLDLFEQKIIRSYLDDEVLTSTEPKKLAKPLTGDMKGLCRFRIDKYRIVCEFKDNELIIMIVKIAHRSKVYK